MTTQFKVTWHTVAKRPTGDVYLVHAHGPAGIVGVGQGLYGDGDDDGTIFDIERIVPDTGGGSGVTLVATKLVSDAPHASPGSWQYMRGGEGAQPVRVTPASELAKGAEKVIDAAGEGARTIAILIGLYFVYEITKSKR